MATMEIDDPRAIGDRVRIPAWLVYVIGAIATLAISGWVGYAAASSAMNARVSVLENQFQEMRTTIRDIQADVKELLRRP